MRSWVAGWDSGIVPEPVAMFEVLSPSTARTDGTLKTEEYRATPSIQHYVLPEQGAVAAHVFTRTAEAWGYELLQKGGAIRREARSRLPAIGVSLPLAMCYAGIAGA